jgi:hypothetical protein
MKFGIKNAHIKLSVTITLVEHGPYITEVQAKLTMSFSKNVQSYKKIMSVIKYGPIKERIPT